MQLAAAISEEDGDENKDEEEEGDESEEDDISRYGFFIRMQYRIKFAFHAFVAMFTWKFIKKMSRLIRNITFKEIILFTIITSYKLAKVGFQFSLNAIYLGYGGGTLVRVRFGFNILTVISFKITTSENNLPDFGK